MATVDGKVVARNSQGPLRIVACLCGFVFCVLAILPELLKTGVPGFGALQTGLAIAGVVIIAVGTLLWKRTGKLSTVVGRLCLPILALMFTWGIVEAAVWYHMRNSPAASYVGRWEFRAGQPAPYQGAPFFNKAFLDESMRSVRSPKVPPGRNYILLGDAHGKYFNVANGRRRTTNQPRRATRRVLIFGGSTVFCQETPDNWTLPSCVQREINRRCSDGYRVENHSAVSMIALQQTARLKDAQPRAGDIVIFYDGFNEVFYPVYCGTTKGWLPKTGRDHHDNGVRQLSWLEKKTYPVWMRFRDFSPLSRWMLRRYEGFAMIARPETSVLNANVETAVESYEATLRNAAGFAAGRQARFVHVLQPNLFTLSSPTKYERRLAKNDLITLPGLDEATRLAYSNLREVTRQLNGYGVASFDLLDAFDNRPEGAEYYLDYCHLNHTGNERIAKLIVDRLIRADVLKERR